MWCVDACNVRRETEEKTKIAKRIHPSLSPVVEFLVVYAKTGEISLSRCSDKAKRKFHCIFLFVSDSEQQEENQR